MNLTVEKLQPDAPVRHGVYTGRGWAQRCHKINIQLITR